MISLNQITPELIVQWFKQADRKTIIKLGVGIVACVLILVLVVWPAWISRIILKQKIKAIKEQMVSLDELNRGKPELVKNRAEYQKVIKEVRERLFKPGETSLLLGTISKMAVEAQVAIVSSNPKDQNEEFPSPFNKKYESALYDITVEGGYHQLGNFISRLESNAKILRIQNFHLESDEKNEELHTATLLIAAISKKEKEKDKEK